MLYLLISLDTDGSRTRTRMITKIDVTANVKLEHEFAIHEDENLDRNVLLDHYVVVAAGLGVPAGQVDMLVKKTCFPHHLRSRAKEPSNLVRDS